MSTVRIPPVLRAAAGGAKEIEVRGSTVGEVLGSLVDQFPGLRTQLLTDDGERVRLTRQGKYVADAVIERLL